MALLTPEIVYRRYNTMGVPDSLEHMPKKSEIIQLLSLLFGVSRGGWVVAKTAAELNGATPEAETDGGVVLNDPDASLNGYYQREGGEWVHERGFPDTLSTWTQTGGGAAAYQVTTADGVDIGNAVLALFVPTVSNAAGATVSLNGAAPVPLYSATGAAIAAGELAAGKASLLAKVGDEWRVLLGQAGLAYRGAWADATTYAADDIAESGGSLWLALQSNTDVEPIEGADWTLFLPGASVADGSITEPKFVTGSVSERALADEAVTEEKLAEASVSLPKLDPITRTVIGAQSAPSFDMHRDTKAGYVRYNFGTGMSNFQAHAFDEVNGYLYTLQHSDSGDGGAGGPAKVSRFRLSGGEGPNAPILVDAQNDSYLLEHQTLSVEYLPSGATKLWTGIGPKFSRGMCRFDYVASGAPANVENFELFDPSVFALAHATGSISYDQKWLVCRGLSAVGSIYGGKSCIAVFDLAELAAAGPGNRWSLAKWMWPIDDYAPDGVSDPQAVLCDGKSVYTLFGPLDINLPNIIRQYTLDGVLIEESPEILIGKADSAALSDGLANEWEGAAFVRIRPEMPPVLTVGYVQGQPTFYKRIYVFGPSQPLGRSSLSIGKNAVDQTIPTAANTKVAIGASTFFLKGIGMDAANSRIIPRSGQKLRLMANIHFLSGLVSGQLVQIYIYKNGAVFRRIQQNASGASQTFQISATLDEGNSTGTDYYEIWAYAAGAGDKVISGSGGYTWVEAEEL